MIKLLLLCLLIFGVLCTPLQSYEILDDVENEAEVIDAAEPLRGIGNLREKSVPVIRLTIPAGYLGIIGNRNLAERSQVPFQHGESFLPGSRNLAEKSLPEAALRRNTYLRRAKSAEEKVDY